MEISYKREMRRNYMIVKPAQERETGYIGRMLLSNRIPGVLPFEERRKDDEIWFYYEITSRQPLNRMLESGHLAAEQIRSFVRGLARVLEEMERYLLPEQCVLLEPGYVYIEPESFAVWLCLVPGYCADFPEAFGKLWEYLLGKVDHQDKEAVVLAYGIYQETRRENYGIGDLLRIAAGAGSRQENSKTRGDSGRDGEAGREEDTGGEAAGASRLPRNAVETYSPQEPAGQVLYGEGAGRGSRFFGGGERKAGDAGGEALGLFKSLGPLRRNSRQREKKKREAQMVSLPWEMMEKNEAAREPGRRAQAGEISMPDGVRTTPDRAQTALLADLRPKKEGTHFLQALDPGFKDILIAYYPFVIGKQENLVDCCLDRETVSRLHLRIDREGESCFVQDLNSTNGTAVAGRLLENNESAEVRPGDEISIAGLRYVFH